MFRGSQSCQACSSEGYTMCSWCVHGATVRRYGGSRRRQINPQCSANSQTAKPGETLGIRADLHLPSSSLSGGWLEGLIPGYAAIISCDGEFVRLAGYVPRTLLMPNNPNVQDAFGLVRYSKRFSTFHTHRPNSNRKRKMPPTLCRRPRLKSSHGRTRATI